MNEDVVVSITLNLPLRVFVEPLHCGLVGKGQGTSGVRESVWGGVRECMCIRVCVIVWHVDVALLKSLSETFLFKGCVLQRRHHLLSLL